MSDSNFINTALNNRIRAFLEANNAKLKIPETSPEYRGPPEVIVAAPAPAVVIDNSVHNHAPVVPIPSQKGKDEEEEKGLTAGQVLGVAVVATATAGALSYFWHSATSVDEMKKLRNECEAEIRTLEAKRQVNTQFDTSLSNVEDKLLYNTMMILDLCIEYHLTWNLTTLTTVGSAGVATVGTILVPRFLTSPFGILNVGVTCISTFLFMNNWWRFNHSHYNDLEKTIVESLNQIAGQK